MLAVKGADSPARRSPGDTVQSATCRLFPAVFVVLALAGCGGGGGGHGASRAARRSQAPTPPASQPGRTLNLPGLGAFTVRCPRGGPYRVRFTVDRDRATVTTVVRAAGQVVKRASLDPGQSLEVAFPVTTRRAGGDRVTSTPPIVWSVESATEPQTLRGSARLRLADSMVAPAPACRFLDGRMSLGSSSNSRGP